MLYFVGVGPGDPELITMKAVRILQEADMIVLPDTGKNSVVWEIIQRWVKNKPVHSVSVPMHGAKQEWQAAHQHVSEQICELLEEYETVAMGDSENDLPMLEYADLSVAMGNGVKEVKEKADYVTDKIDNDGLYKAFKYLKLF